MKTSLNSLGLHRSTLLLRLCMLLACISLTSMTDALAGITITDSNISLQNALAAVKQQADVYVMYENDVINPEQTISLDLNDASLASAMEAICGKTGLRYEIKGRYVLLTPASQGKAGFGSRIVTGRVTDKGGEPLPGVSVIISGKASGTVTNIDGDYSIRVRPGEKLTFRYIGMYPEDYTIADERHLDVSMRPDTQSLGEVSVVSTGYQSLSRERATGAFATLSAEQLKKIPTPNVVQRLEGQLPGMKVNVLSGDRTFAYSNTLQSANSSTRTLGASDYSMQIRGVSTINGEKMPLLVVDGVISDFDISSIDPSVIENITVLKDAAAASIWGARAANGVIVVTTKKGEKNTRPSVSFSASWMTQNKPDLDYLNKMTAAQTLEYEKDLVDRNYFYASTPYDYYSAQSYMPEGIRLAMGLKDGSITQQQYDSRIAELSRINMNDDINEYMLQRATSQQYNISVNGGSANNTYFYSASYAKENPTEKRSGASRININLSNTWKLFNRATLTTAFTGTFFKYKNNGTNLRELMGNGVFRLRPYSALANPDGTGIDYDMLDPAWTSTLGEAYHPWTYNYIDELNLRDDVQRTDNYTANISLNIPLVWGISSLTTYALERSYTSQETWTDPATYDMRNRFNFYTPAGATSNSLGLRNGALYNLNSDNRNWTFREQLNYDGSYGIHRINALAGIELRQTYINQSTSKLWGYNRDSGLTDAPLDYTYNSTYPTIAGYTSSFNGGEPMSSVNRRRRFLSYYGNAGYTLLDRYYLTGSVRYDDYNNFGLDRKYRAKPFYSVGAKWNISREQFMENQASWLSMLTVRATYGVNGNIAQDVYPFTHISYTSNYNTGQPSVFISALANPQLRWEKTNTTNIGIDFAFFNHRLSGSADYYWKKGRDLLYTFDFSSTIVGNIANSQMTRNAVAIDGRGFDLNLRGTVFNNRDWNVTIGANLSWSSNEVKSNPFFTEKKNLTYINNSPTSIGMVGGYPTDRMFAFKWAGLDENGVPMVYNSEGEKVAPSGLLDSLDDLTYVGHLNPTTFGGINLNVRWKGFTLYSLFTYQFGSHFFAPTMSGYSTGAYARTWDFTSDIADRWRQPGDELHTNVPAITSDYMAINRYKFADCNVHKGDYLRWRQLSLTYDLPIQLLSKIGVKGANIGLAVSNLGLLWKANKIGLDPDFTAGLNSLSMPAQTSYTLNLSLNF